MGVCVENAETHPLRRLGAMGTGKYPTKLYMAYGRLPKPNCWRGACLWAEINTSPVSRNVRDTPMATAKMWNSTYDKSYVQEFPLYCITRSQCDLFSERKHFFHSQISARFHWVKHYGFNNFGVQWRGKTALYAGATEEV